MSRTRQLARARGFDVETSGGIGCVAAVTPPLVSEGACRIVASPPRAVSRNP